MLLVLDAINIYDTHNHHQNYFGGWTFWAQKSHLRFVPTHYSVISLSVKLRKYNQKKKLY